MVRKRHFLSHNLSEEDPKASHNHTKLLSLLQAAAHTYDESARNYKQTIAMSVFSGSYPILLSWEAIK